MLAACAVLCPLALYLPDITWTLQPHRTHRRWCDAEWSHQRVTLTATVATALLSLLGAG